MSGELAAQEVESYLRTVAVGEHHVPPRGQHPGDVAAGLAQGLDLTGHAGMRFVFNEGVAPDGNDGNGHGRLLLGSKHGLAFDMRRLLPPADSTDLARFEGEKARRG